MEKKMTAKHVLMGMGGYIAGAGGGIMTMRWTPLNGQEAIVLSIMFLLLGVAIWFVGHLYKGGDRYGA